MHTYKIHKQAAGLVRPDLKPGQFKTAAVWFNRVDLI